MSSCAGAGGGRQAAAYKFCLEIVPVTYGTKRCVGGITKQNRLKVIAPVKKTGKMAQVPDPVASSKNLSEVPYVASCKNLSLRTPCFVLVRW